ncbi:hypothetical protein DJ568_15920 [Mucilaginibacter hurinus]|uniref:Glycerophosphoryl diester phosphodiesterase membrane domain-containing protein n=1 Tax=Mucilaginibacter hurinus TaxID=2201324 RepID=A0A367GL48_9SPHI|nr:hypothetical protein [Mucilaginibacter hurinus]RCH53725.1 hypothetical protein DJ568_15920 [Mucilaginibacter hurinus]
MKPHFELRRIRDFGEIISDSFDFFKHNIKALVKPLIVITGFFLLITVIAHIMMQMNTITVMEGIRSGDPSASQNSVVDIYKGMGYYYAGVLPLILGVYLVTYSYMAISLEKKDGNKPTLEEVWGYFKYYFLRSAGAFIITVILCVVGTVLCLLPGIYLGVVLSLLLPVIVFENGSFSYAFGKSFKLISGNWWLTFGVILVMVMVVGFSGSIASIPIALITSFNTFLNIDTAIVYPLIALLSTLMHAIILIGYSLVAVAVALCYFSFTEQKDGTSLLQRIDQLGKQGDDNSNLPTEQY